MVNKVILIGNLGADPEVRQLENGATVAKLRVATNESYKDKESGEWKDLTEWHSVIAWRYLAENAQRNFSKGTTVYIEGKLTTRKWTNSEGKDQYTTEVVASYMRKISKSGDNNRSFPNANDEPSNIAKTSNTPKNKTNEDFTPAEDNNEDDLPF